MGIGSHLSSNRWQAEAGRSELAACTQYLDHKLNGIQYEITPSRVQCFGVHPCPPKARYRRVILTPLIFRRTVRCEAADRGGVEVGGYDRSGPAGLLRSGLVGEEDRASVARFAQHGAQNPADGRDGFQLPARAAADAADRSVARAVRAIPIVPCELALPGTADVDPALRGVALARIGGRL
jgi:hypothetical protein